VVFSPHETRRYVGCGWPGSTHKEQPEQPNLLATTASRSYNLRLGGRGGSSPGVSRAPEGGGTTQRGDPAPGPMRCGTTASGDERMHQ
jgi:hypothetical protein